MSLPTASRRSFILNFVPSLMFVNSFKCVALETGSADAILLMQVQKLVCLQWVHEHLFPRMTFNLNAWSHTVALCKHLLRRNENYSCIDLRFVIVTPKIDLMLPFQFQSFYSSLNHRFWKMSLWNRFEKSFAINSKCQFAVETTICKLDKHKFIDQ